MTVSGGKKLKIIDQKIAYLPKLSYFIYNIG